MNAGDSAGWVLPQAPYPGLRSFEEHESSVFRGRDWQVAAVLRLLDRYRFVVVTGASGCGKSSLVRAGVLAELYRGSLESAGDVWIEAYFRPGKDPLGNLATALTERLVRAPVDPGGTGSRGETEREEVAALLDRPNGLAMFRERFEDRLALDPQLDAVQSPESEAATQAAGEARKLRRDANLLILADQFEEIFNEFNQGSASADVLVARLLEAFRAEESESQQPAAARVHVVVTMRSEYLGRCATYRGMPVALNNAAFYVSRLDRAELRVAAVEPLHRWQRLAGRKARSRREFDEELLARLLDAAILTKDDPDHLPLFQHALARLWWLAQGPSDDDGQSVRRIGRPHLARALGLPEAEAEGLPGSRLLARVLEAHAEEVYGALDAESGRVAEVMLRRLATKEHAGNVVRRLAPVRDVAACAGCPDSTVEMAVQLLGAPQHELVQTRQAAGPGGTLIDLAHEALIRKWPRFSRWVDEENELALSFLGLLRRARRWAEAGGGDRNLLRDDDLLWARRWVRTTKLYRRSAGAISAWAARYVGASAERWTERFGGPVAAVGDLCRESIVATRRSLQERKRQVQAAARIEAEVKQAEAEIRQARAEAEAAEAQSRQAAAERDAQRWRLWLVGSLATAAVALLVGGGLWYRANIAEQKRLTEIADLYASALANSNLELGRLPPDRHTAIQQELAVILGRIEQLRMGDPSPDAEERLRTLERSVDGAARQTLEATVIPVTRLETSSSEDEQTGLVKACALRVDPGKQRAIKQVAPLTSPTDPARPGRRAYVVLSRLENVATLEVVYYRAFKRGKCSLGMDGVALSVPTVDDVTMDAAGRWLIERPRAAPNAGAVGPRLYRLNWFEGCDRVGKNGSCDPRRRRWRVELIRLGEYPGLEANQLPSLPERMPAPRPVAWTGSDVPAVSSADPVDDLEIRPGTDGSGESGGSELYWRRTRLSSRAQPGWLVAAYARQGDLVAFVVSARALNARRQGAGHAGTACGGGELCQHVLRVVRMPQGDGRDPATAAIPVAEVRFDGPPVDGVGFGTGALGGELVLRFAETGGFATVSLGGAEFKEWLCMSRVPGAVPEPLFFSQAFRNYVTTQHGGYDRIGAVVDAACG